MSTNYICYAVIEGTFVYLFVNAQNRKRRTKGKAIEVVKSDKDGVIQKRKKEGDLEGFVNGFAES